MGAGRHIISPPAGLMQIFFVIWAIFYESKYPRMFSKVVFLLLTILLYQVNVLLPAAQPVTGLSLEKIMMVDEKKISYVSDNNLYLLDPENGSVRQLTDFRRVTAPSEKAVTPEDKWLEQQLG